MQLKYYCRSQSRVCCCWR